MYDKQRDKITTDLRKLKDYAQELQTRLGSTKISRWVFVTPEIDRNALLAHAKAKEAEVRAWKLPILTDDFTVLLHDGDHYLVEINEVRAACGEALVFDDTAPVLAALTGQQEQYEINVHRKSGYRLAEKAQVPDFQTRVQLLSQRTIEQFLEADGYFRRVASASPMTHVRLIRLINEYEQYVIETSATWSGTAEELTIQVRDGLSKIISDELAPEFDKANTLKVARYMTARWLAVCELDYG